MSSRIDSPPDTNHAKLDRLSYWTNGSRHHSRKHLLIGDRTFLKSWLIENDDYSAITRVVHQILTRSLSGGVDTLAQVLSAINHTTSLQVKKHWDLLTQLESHMLTMLDKLGCLTGIEGIEFPVNVRVTHGTAPEGYLDRDHATDRLHSDIWSGEPSDSVNCFLYIDGDLAHTFLELFDPVPSSADTLAAYRGAYAGAKTLTDEATRVDYEPRNGQFFIFDSICPHRTMRTGGGGRITVDFRLRRLDPYGAIDERWNRPRQPWAKYWYLPQKRHESFRSRCSEEMRRLEDSRDLTKCRSREDWIAKLQSEQE